MINKPFTVVNADSITDLLYKIAEDKELQEWFLQSPYPFLTNNGVSDEDIEILFSRDPAKLRLLIDDKNKYDFILSHLGDALIKNHNSDLFGIDEETTEVEV
jgi:hypothetical protein